MSFLLDTDICSAYLKNDRRTTSKVMLHFGALHVSVITVGELLTTQDYTVVHGLTLDDWCAN